MAIAHPTGAPVRPGAVLALTIGAALVTIGLTVVAFWLSYEGLHDLATGHHLTGARAWAWPATLDSFVGVGELLVLRASLMRRLDWFAMTLVAAGSAGSIVLNVVSVGANVDPVTQVVAAVPPVSALLAFTALMRQLHRALVASPDPEPPTRATVDRPTPADAPLTAVTTPALPPRPTTSPALPAGPAPWQAAPVVYEDPRCLAIRPLYNNGSRPTSATMATALINAGHARPSGGTLRGVLRAEVERLEPHLALFPSESALVVA
jgi:hypothetical protein